MIGLPKTPKRFRAQRIVIDQTTGCTRIVIDNPKNGNGSKYCPVACDKKRGFRQ